jgi:tetratricopeptide (TPR) repeat protein
VESIIQWLSEMDLNWLLVFDNADGQPNAVSEYFPPGNQGNILITSRNPHMKRNASTGAWIEVDEMDESDAVSLLLKAAFLDESSEELRKIAKSIVTKLHFLPLAVHQAGAFIANGLCDIQDYLQMYSDHRRTLMEHQSLEGASDYGRAVYATWDLSYKALEAKVANGSTAEADGQAAESAITILHIFAFLHYDGITEDIFRRAAEALQGNDINAKPTTSSDLPRQLLNLRNGGTWDPSIFRDGIRILLSFSLVKTSSEGFYCVHPLVHCWSRDRMSQIEQQKIGCSVKALLSRSITHRYASEDYAYRRRLLPHIKAVECYVADAGTRKMYNEEEYTNFAFVLSENGYWKEAEKLEVDVMETRARVLGAEHPETLVSMMNLASTYSSMGWLKKALDLEAKVVEARRRVLGAEHPETLLSMGNLAATYWRQGQYKEAEELQVDGLEATKRMFGAEHPETLVCMNNLASTYRKQKKLKEAEKLEVDALEARRRVFGTEHPTTLISMSNLASTYRQQGKLKEAEDLEVEVMEAMKRVLGAEHPDTLISMGNLAATYLSQGKLKEAEKLMVDVVDAKRRVLGVEHPDTLMSMSNLASAYSEQGLLKEAADLEAEVIEIMKRVLGAEHPDTLVSMANLASTYKKQGQLKEAEGLEVEVMEAMKRVLGAEHPNTLVIMGNLASTYRKQGQLKEAEDLEVDVMEARKRVLGAVN